MAVPLLDKEFMQYWSQLSVIQKESLLNVARTYLKSAESTESASERRRKMILEDRENYLNDVGSSYSWEQVKQMASDKEKRNAL